MTKRILKILLLLLAFSSFVVSCGSSEEEFQKRLKEFELKGKEAYMLFKSHMPEYEPYVKQLELIKDSLQTPTDSSFAFSGKLEPALITEGEGMNLLKVEYDLLRNTSPFYYESVLDHSYDLDAQQALLYYYKVKFDTIEQGQNLYPDSAQWQRYITLLNIKKTPYAMILRKVMQSDIKLNELENKYSGGEILSYVWLVDLRVSKVIGSLYFVASPGTVSVKTKDSKYTMEEEINNSARANARETINMWLSMF